MVWLTRRCRPHARAAKTWSMDRSPVGRRQSARARHRLWARCSQVMARSAGGGQPPSTGAATEAVSVSERQRRAWWCWVLGWPGRQVRVLPAASARRWLPTGRPDVVGIPAASSSNGHAATDGARRVSPSPRRSTRRSVACPPRACPPRTGWLAQSVGPLRGVGSRKWTKGSVTERGIHRRLAMPMR